MLKRYTKQLSALGKLPGAVYGAYKAGARKRKVQDAALHYATTQKGSLLTPTQVSSVVSSLSSNDAYGLKNTVRDFGAGDGRRTLYLRKQVRRRYAK